MTHDEVMQTLQKLGTEQNRKTYRRHGAGENVYGVSFADLGVLKKKIRCDHDLATQLWESGNFDAQNLATMIADPARMNAAEMGRWVKAVDSYPVAGLLGTLVAQTPQAQAMIAKWTASKAEWIGTTGWDALAAYAAAVAKQGRPVENDFYLPYLAQIETGMAQAPNRVRHAMNGALIAIGSLGGELAEQSFAVADKIGKVIVDHGQTDCKTPDARAYIEKTLAYRAAKAAAPKTNKRK